ncbi:hypothetical protein IRY61_05150 [Candidatus Saccharibacteria bacterium]|nr:hypothetical protein [Candidatus Saccharibacteria bacterium]
MRVSGRIGSKYFFGPLAAACLSVIMLWGVGVQASAATINPLPTPEPGVGSYGLEATKPKPPPENAPVITTPAGGASFSESPITVSGLCEDGLNIQVYNNGVMVGADICEGGSFSLLISLFAGQNDITAIQYDELGQASPVSNTVTVTFNNANFEAFGTLITLTSNYGRRAANPGQVLTWPLQLSGGTGPYAFSINWGDDSDPDLKSVPVAGEVEISHVYKRAGIYRVTIKVTDVNGVSAFLQVIAIANGQPVETEPVAEKNAITITRVIWWPAAVVMALMPIAFWLGRQSQMFSLRRKIEKEVEQYREL